MRIAVIGSGLAGCAAALSLLERGAHVTLFDCGDDDAAISKELQDVTARTATSASPIDATLLDQLSGANVPSRKTWRQRGLTGLLAGGLDESRTRKRIMGSDFVFRNQQRFFDIDGADLPVSAAPGGLSNVWGSACYPMRPGDFKDWPIEPGELSPFYQDAAHLLGLNARDDGLANSYQLFGKQTGPRPLTPLSALAPIWQAREQALQAHGLDGGRSRLALRFSDCTHCGLCLFGCPHNLISTSRPWIRQISSHPKGAYHGYTACLDFHETAQGVRLTLLDQSFDRKSVQTFDSVFLAAGTLGSFRIAAQSMNQADLAAPLLDNDMAIFLNWIRQPRNPGQDAIAPFSLSEMALALRPSSTNTDGVHFQFYSFSPYFFGELAAGRLFGLLHQSGIWRHIWPKLAIGFAYLSGAQSRSVKISARPGNNPFWQLNIHGADAPINSVAIKGAIGSLRTARATTQLDPLRPSIRSTPFGFSGHVTGTLPMTKHPGTMQTDKLGRLADHQRVYVVDGAAFPQLPAQNPTFTIVANALRVAKQARI